MTEGIQESIGVVTSAGESIVSQGTLGALLILSLAANVLLGWLLYRARSEFNRFLQMQFLARIGGTADGE